MWTFRGTIASLVLFLGCTLVFLLIKAMPIEQSKAMSVHTLMYLTTRNPWYWCSFVLLMIACCLAAKILYARSAG